MCIRDRIIAVFKNLAMPMPKNHFTIGIVDDVTFTSLPQEEEIALGGASMFLSLIHIC